MKQRCCELSGLFNFYGDILVDKTLEEMEYVDYVSVGEKK